MGAREIVGSYENEMMTLTIGSDGGRAYSRSDIKPEIPCGGKHRTTPESPAGWLRPVVLFIISSSSVVTVRQFLIVPIVRSLESKYWLVSFVPATPPCFLSRFSHPLYFKQERERNPPEASGCPISRCEDARDL